MVFTVLGAVAELDRNIIRERVTAGLRRAKEEDKTLGRPRVIVDRVKVRQPLRADFTGAESSEKFVNAPFRA